MNIAKRSLRRLIDIFAIKEMVNASKLKDVDGMISENIKITRKQLRKILYENYFQILLEGIDKKALISKYAKLDIYEKYLTLLHPKYYNQLDNYYTKYNEDYEDFSYGLVMYLLLMHQKYAKTKYIPPGVKDFNNVDLPVMKQSIEGFGAQYSDRQLYKELEELDKEVNEIITKENEEENEENQDNVKSSLVNKAVRSGLILLKKIDGWQVLLPTSVEGSQSIGVKSWCTVYSGAWSTYRQTGISLYYLAKDGKNYDEKGYGFDYEANPYEYICLGFDANGSLNLSGGDYGTSVWGDQKGVTKENLNNYAGANTTIRIIEFLKAHYKSTGGTTRIMTKDDAEKAQKKMEINKRKEAMATMPRVFKLFMRDLPPNVAFDDVLMMALSHPSLNDAMANFIFNKYILKVDSKMRRTTTYTTGSELVFKTAVVLKLLKAHISLDSRVANTCLGILIKAKMLRALIYYGTDVFHWGVWANKDLSRDICEYIEDLIQSDLFGSAKKANLHKGNILQYNTIKLYRKLISNCDNAVSVFEESYKLGNYDEFGYVWATHINRTDFNTYQTPIGELISMFNDIINNNKTSETIKTEMLSEKIKGYEKSSEDDIGYSSIMFSRVRMKKTQHDLDELSNKIGTKLTENDVEDAINAEKSARLLNDLFSNANNRLTVKTIRKSDTIRNKLKNHLYYLIEKGERFYNIGAMTSRGGNDLPEMVYLAAAHLLEDDEYFKVLNKYKSFDKHYVGYQIYKTCLLTGDIEKMISAYDYLNSLISEYVANDTKTQYGSSAADQIRKQIIWLVYGGSQGAGSSEQIKITLSIIQNHFDIFVNCLEHAFNRKDDNKMDDIYNMSSGITRILQIAINSKKITYDQAMEYFKKINPIADKLGHPHYNRFIGRLQNPDD